MALQSSYACVQCEVPFGSTKVSSSTANASCSGNASRIDFEMHGTVRVLHMAVLQRTVAVALVMATIAKAVVLSRQPRPVWCILRGFAMHRLWCMVLLVE